MKHHIQSSRFDENETDQLIANFGIKLSPEKRHEIQTCLTGEKERFLAHERGREVNTREQSNRSI